LSTQVSSLLVGDRVVSRCDDGLLEAEYALFDGSEVLLSPAGREEGYMTGAGLARTRLYQGLVTAELAYEAFTAMRARQLRPLARSAAVRGVVEHLGPYETFQGGRFVASRGRYTGLWLDLDVLAAQCPLRDASILFQSLHLVLVLEEVADDAPVRLLTSQIGGGGTAGGRTWRRIDLQQATRLPWVLREMPALARPHGTAHDEAEVREEILRDLRARAMTTAIAQPRLSTLAAAIARTGSTPPGAMPQDAPPPTPRMSSRPPRHSPGPVQVPDANDIHATVRHYNDLLNGSDNLRTVAESLTARVDGQPFVADLAILAARAWLGAGERGYARHFARLVVDDPSAADDLRVLALEILDATAAHEAARPPSTQSVPEARAIVLSGGTERRAPPVAIATRPARSTPPPDGGSPLGDRRSLDPRLILLSEPDSQRSASFRLLRDNLLAKKAPRIIAVSSGAVHEGKTTCAINLALALSERPSTRVLLMDGNFFAPSLAAIFHIDAQTPVDPQVSLPLLSPYRIAQMMRGFHVAALVQEAGEPALTFNSRWFDMVIGHLSGADYDHLVIDAAALDGSPAVTQVLGVADGTLLTARTHSTTARSFRRAAEQIPEGRALGVTLMDG
jgi:Mrp family chromosome partitioning ATPase